MLALSMDIPLRRSQPALIGKQRSTHHLNLPLF